MEKNFAMVARTVSFIFIVSNQGNKFIIWTGWTNVLVFYKKKSYKSRLRLVQNIRKYSLKYSLLKKVIIVNFYYI